MINMVLAFIIALASFLILLMFIGAVTSPKGIRRVHRSRHSDHDRNVVSDRRESVSDIRDQEVQQKIRALELDIYGHTWGNNAVDNKGRPWPLPLPPPLPEGTRVVGTRAGTSDWYYDDRGNPVDPYADKEY
jgi:hypothetical protein